MTLLDWRKHPTGKPERCIHCRRPAICRNEHNEPAHKVCAEQQIPTTLTGGAL
jgi:hypothetical protein